MRVRLATSGRNTLATQPTNDFSLATYKDINITERIKFRFGAQFANILNHPQYIPGSNPGQGLGVNDVTSFITGPNSTSYLNYLTPGNAIFNNPKVGICQQRSHHRVGGEVHLLNCSSTDRLDGALSGPVFLLLMFIRPRNVRGPCSYEIR